MHSYWSEEKVYFSSTEYFDDLLDAIFQARKSIDLEVYIYANDETGTKITKALCQAAKRGVRVRVLVDGFGSPFWYYYHGQELLKAGAQARVYHPLPLKFSTLMIKRFPFVTLQKAIRLLAYANRRNHRKTWVIDDQTAWAGSMNITSTHHDWHDTAVKVKGEAIVLLKNSFERAWIISQHEHRWTRLFSQEHPLFKADLQTVPVRINHSWSKRYFYTQDLIRRIAQAKKRVWISNAYFIPHPRIIRALRFAAWSQADVKILLSKKSDVFFIPWVSAFFYSKLLQSGVKIFEYQPKVLHSKTMLIDDWATVGSTNLNTRSFLHDLEVDIVLSSSSSIQALQNQFLEDIKNAHEMTLQNTQIRPWYQKLIGRIFLSLRKWL